MKTLIAYYSRKGQNYGRGKPVNLAIGNTEVVAKKIQTLIGGELFEIDTVKSYAEDYNECVEEAKNEWKKNLRPQLKASVENMEEYDIIYLGYPNWWGTMPMAVFTFLESYSLVGKTIYPFCTNEGSGMGVSERDLKKLCKEANICNSLAIIGSQVNESDKDIKKWIYQQGVKINE